MPHAVQTLVSIRDLIFSIQRGGNTHFSRGEIRISARWKYSQTARHVSRVFARSETAPAGDGWSRSFRMRQAAAPGTFILFERAQPAAVPILACSNSGRIFPQAPRLR